MIAGAKASEWTKLTRIKEAPSISWLCILVVRRKLMLVILGTVGRLIKTYSQNRVYKSLPYEQTLVVAQ